MDAAELVIRMTSDATDAVAGFDSVGNAAQEMAADVDAATANADASASRLDGVADAADNMGSKSAQAAGGLGDLGGALSMMPGPLGALGSGMESVAPAIMGVTGAADLANLALGSNIVQSVRARAATVAHAVASRATAAATRTAAAAQWVLNAAMAANPIGLAVVALALLVAGFVLAYNKSETFRRIVDAAMRGAREAIGWVVDKLGNLVEFVSGKASNVWEGFKSAATGAINAVLAPIRTAIDLVQDLLDWIGKIDFPDLPDLNPFNGKSIVGGLPGSSGTATSSGTTIDARAYFDIDASGLVDTNTLLALLLDLMRRQGIRLGELVPGAKVILA